MNRPDVTSAQLEALRRFNERGVPSAPGKKITRGTINILDSKLLLRWTGSWGWIISDTGLAVLAYHGNAAYEHLNKIGLQPWMSEAWFRWGQPPQPPPPPPPTPRQQWERKVRNARAIHEGYVEGRDEYVARYDAQIAEHKATLDDLLANEVPEEGS